MYRQSVVNKKDKEYTSASAACVQKESVKAKVKADITAQAVFPIGFAEYLLKRYKNR